MNSSSWPGRVAITQARLVDFAGSETATFELAEFFSVRGADVWVGSYAIGGEWNAAFADLDRVRLGRLDDEDHVKRLSLDPPELCWIHHQIVPEPILREPGAARFVFNHMSSYSPLEFSWAPDIEEALADLVVFNSPETQRAQIGSRLLADVGSERFALWPNPAPTGYLRPKVPAIRDKPRILVVTNLLPSELDEALGTLDDQFRVSVVGNQTDRGARALRVTPDLVHGSDAVVSIGKTVQYALTAGVPVYCYDHFGGPGWLAAPNIEKAQDLNFSGRGFARKDVEEISRELRGGLVEAHDWIASQGFAWRQAFTIDSAWKRVAARLDRVATPSREIRATETEAHVVRQAAIGTYVHEAAHHQIKLAEARFSRAIGGRAQGVKFMELPARIGRHLRRLARRVFCRGHRVDVLPRVRAWLVEGWRVRVRSWSSWYKISVGPCSDVGQGAILALMRVRNEELIIRDTLDHLATFTDAVIVFDDASEDATVAIALEHPAVLEVVQNRRWRPRVRAWEETANRRAIFKRGLRHRPEWFVYADADERFEGAIRSFLREDAPAELQGIRVSLLDAYMTPGDHEGYAPGASLLGFRQFFGPERRDILMIWRNAPGVDFRGPDAREPIGVRGVVETRFWCQHYGKALSVDHWEDTCRYYADHFPGYAEKWRARMGKAVHTQSDFGADLMTWDVAKEESRLINP